MGLPMWMQGWLWMSRVAVVVVSLESEGTLTACGAEFNANVGRR